MTREEAERAVEDAWRRRGGDCGTSAAYVRMFEALGVLKLDDPNAKMRDNAARVLVGRNYDGSIITNKAAREMIDSLLLNGFKITR